MRTRTLLLAGCAALGCATARPTSAPARNTPATSGAAASASGAAIVTPGLTAAEVRRRLGDPRKVERVPSAAVQGAVYERWAYPDREVVLLDGKVIGVAP